MRPGRVKGVRSVPPAFDALEDLLQHGFVITNHNLMDAASEQ